MTIALYANEVVTKAGNAQYLNIDNQVKGKLILTNQRLYFKQLADKVNGLNIEIEPKEIRELMYFKTRMIFQNGLSLITKEGKELKFIVKDRDSWSQMINRMC
ncbi:MAG: hypothetical protein CVU00_03575 [Bacteroidetes bacterium HGW-Bacteroidetes-17]|jgi:hypothetical protein|nr:MAG: hypothetical protein CVU00_03575 [Bacteroidetes bacterium HGW-Bacteroidetes-17]